MEDKEKVTPTEEIEKVEKTFSQTEVNDLIKDRLAREKDKIAKDLGIGEDFNKEEYSKYKEFIANQKTEAEKLAEENEKLKKEKEEALSLVKQSKIERVLDEVLKELTIDTKYNKTVLKLADLGELEDISVETMKPIIETLIEEELPMLINSEKIKVGADKTKEKEVVSGTKEYLDKKYSNNPYYKK